MKWKSTLAAGLAAGILDISGALIVYVLILKVTSSEKVLQSVASGVYGKSAYQGGLRTALIGLGLHFFLAILWSVLFNFLYPAFKTGKLPVVLAGIFYGLFVWLAMNYIVLPLSSAVTPKLSWKYTSISVALIVFLVGLPIVLVTSVMQGRKSQLKNISVAP